MMVLKYSMQYRELSSQYRCRTFEWRFEFQCGTAVFCVFVTGPDARKFYAETSKKRNETGTMLGLVKPGAFFRWKRE